MNAAPNPLFSAAPSLDPSARALIAVGTSFPGSATAIGYPVARSGPVPVELGVDGARLEAGGFDASVGSTLVLPSSSGPIPVAVGIGEPAVLDSASLRDAAAAFARSVATNTRLALVLSSAAAVTPEAAAHSAVEGVLLARYHYGVLKREPRGVPVQELTLVTTPDNKQAAQKGAERGRVFASAQMLARDLANTPHSHLNASRFADLAAALGAEKGFEVEVFDKAALIELECGGLLGVNAGSTERPG